MSLGEWFFCNIVKKGDEERMSKQTYPVLDEVRDIEYLPDGHKHHQLDIYKPKNAVGKLPVIIDIHGGGWYYGDKELNKNYCLHIAEEGFAVVNVSYRLCPEVTYVGELQDCFAALDWLSQNGEKYDLDMNNLFITGDSAGGHLISQILATSSNPEMQKYYGVTPKLKFNAACFTCAVFDVSKLAKKPLFGIAYFNDVLGKGYRRNKNLKFADFIPNIPADICPCYFITAYADAFKNGNLTVYPIIKKMGVDCELRYYDKPLADGNKLEHVFNIIQPDWEASKSSNAGMTEFFRKYIV